MEIDAKERIVVGVNEFISNSKDNPSIQKINEDAIKNQLDRLNQFRKNRDNNLVTVALKKLEESINKNTNIMPNIIECVESKVTLGEISNLLRKKFGEYTN